MNKSSLKVILLPHVFDLIFNRFLALDSPQTMRVCKRFYSIIKSNLIEQAHHVVTALDYQYSKCFKTQNPCIKYLRKKGKAVKNQVDIFVEVELRMLPVLQINKSYTISYSYSYFDYKKEKKNTICWQFQFNVIKSKRCIWLYKQETRNHFTRQNISLIQDVFPVRIDDTMTIRIPYLTKLGFTEIKTLQFYPLLKDNIIQKACEIQKHFEWTLYKYFQHPMQFEIEDIIRMYPDHLEVVEIRCAGIGFINFKIRLRAKRQGDLGLLLDHHISIRGENKPIKACLKKKGCYEEQRAHLQLRIGDELLIYHTPNY